MFTVKMPILYDHIYVLFYVCWKIREWSFLSLTECFLVRDWELCPSRLIHILYFSCGLILMGRELVSQLAVSGDWGPVKSQLKLSVCSSW